MKPSYKFEIAGHALKAHLALRGQPQLFDYIYAQWALESNYGNSELAQHYNNFGGMKYRIELDHLCRPLDYTDWAGETSPHCFLEAPEDYPKLYWAFVHRTPYPEIDKHMETGADFIYYLASCGYVSTESPESYLSKIERVIASDKFKSACSAIFPPEWL